MGNMNFNGFGAQSVSETGIIRLHETGTKNRKFQGSVPDTEKILIRYNILWGRCQMLASETKYPPCKMKNSNR